MTTAGKKLHDAPEMSLHIKTTTDDKPAEFYHYVWCEKFSRMTVLPDGKNSDEYIWLF